MYLYSIYVLVENEMWFSAFFFFFEGHFINKKNRGKIANHGEFMKLMVNILEHEQGSCVVDFLLYAYMNPENDVHKAIHQFHGKGLFLILKQVFVTLSPHL